MKWQHIATATLVTIVLLPAYLLRAKVFGIPTTALEVMVVGVIVSSLVAAGFSLRDSLPAFTRRLKPAATKHLLLTTSVALILIAATISIFTAPDHLAALGVYRAYFLEPFAFAGVLLYLLKHKHLIIDQILTALGISALFISIMAIVQWFFPATIPIPWDIERRVTSVFEYPNSIGLFLAPIVTIAWIITARKRNLVAFTATRLRCHRLFWLAVAVLGSVAIVLAQSEAAIVAILASLLLYLFFNRKTRPHATLLALFALFAFFTLPTLQEKLTLQDYSGGVRLSQWNETWQMLKDRPIFGAGLSGYPEALKPYHKATQYEIFQYPHNIFLNVWSEMGLIGLMGLMGLILTVARRLKPAATNPISPPNIFALPAFFALLTIFIHGLVDVPYFKNDLAILTWIFLILFFYATTTPTKE